jgi:uncharacterized glyoxalase superfamily protein PhnB
MKNGVKPIQDGNHTIIPHLVVRGADRAIAFYKEAFSATELRRHAGPDGKAIVHAELQIGDSKLFLSDEFPEWGVRSPLSVGGTSTTINLCLEDSDKVFAQAVGAGAQVKMPMMDMFWGDRYGKVMDPFGHEWALATHIEDVPPDEMEKRMLAAMAAPTPSPG